jgi:hypothetical protein
MALTGALPASLIAYLSATLMLSHDSGSEGKSIDHLGPAGLRLFTLAAVTCFRP